MEYNVLTIVTVWLPWELEFQKYIILTSLTAIVDELTIDLADGQDLQCVSLSNKTIMKFSLQNQFIGLCWLW